MGSLVYFITLIALLCLCSLMNKAEANQFKIVGGFDANISDAPYTASLRWVHREAHALGSGHFCSGTIIKNRIILTAAHCLYKRSPTDVSVVVGFKYLSRVWPTMKKLRISYWTYHEKYNNKKRAVFDIGLIFTIENIEPVDGAVAYLPLNTWKISTGTECLLSGWARIDHKTRDNANCLQALWQRIMDKEMCFRIIHRPGVLCTDSGSPIGASYGDSGGPLRCNNKLAGVIFATNFRGIALYVDVRAFVGWIEQRISSGIMPLGSFCIGRHVVLAISICVASFCKSGTLDSN
ncbi:myeloblastin-like [Drosophila navojoa]|uniref:myeloblastin-like n=1 Tax=Drosophila navojoa TaxID=7232 RepID=UPI0011BECED3|nr:myeloblastin-like [Drosophila navojoa]